MASASVVAADLEGNEILWTSRLEPEGATTPLPRVGYTDPAGRLIAVSHEHEDGPLHTLYAVDGTVVAGWGTDGADLASGAVLAGWLDEQRLVAVGGGTGGRFLALVIDVGDIGGESAVFDLDVDDPRSVYAVTGTSQLLVGTETETVVFDFERRTFDSLTANCGLRVLGRTT